MGTHKLRDLFVQIVLEYFPRRRLFSSIANSKIELLNRGSIFTKDHVLCLLKEVLIRDERMLSGRFFLTLRNWIRLLEEEIFHALHHFLRVWLWFELNLNWSGGITAESVILALLLHYLVLFLLEPGTHTFLLNGSLNQQVLVVIACTSVRFVSFKVMWALKAIFITSHYPMHRVCRLTSKTSHNGGATA